MKPTKQLARRDFLKATATASVGVAAPYLVASSALGKDDAVPPSERITVGSIGIGAMGQGHLGGVASYPNVQVLAVCDVDQWRRENAKKVVQRVYARRGVAGGEACEAYNDLRDVLARDDIDAVIIATGDNWHGPATVMAAKAGKDIYTEKPISKTICEARAMVEAAHRYGRVTQIGLQQRSTPEFIRASHLVQSGRIGKLQMVYVIFSGASSDIDLPIEPVPEGLDWDLWLGPAPWRPFNHRYHIYGKPPHVVPWNFCRDFGGGALTSNTVHAFDVVQWALGMDESGPVEVIPPESGQVPSLTYKYANGVPLVVADGRLDPKIHIIPKGWDPAKAIENFGALYVGEDGWIHVGRRGVLESYPKEIVQDQPSDEIERLRPVGNHHQNWLQCIKTRQKTVCDVAIGCRSTIVSHLGCIARWTRRPLKWDPVQEQFIDDEEANRLRGRAMRSPWRI